MASKKQDSMRMFVTVEDVYSAIKDGAKLTDVYAFTHPTRTKGKSINLSLGRIWFNLLLPPKYPLVEYAVDQSGLQKIIHECTDILEPSELCEFVSTLNQEAFRLADYVPSTFTIDSLIIPDELKKEKEQLIKDSKDITPAEFSQRLNMLSDKFSDYSEANGYRLNDVLVSGVKGGKTDWNALMFLKGYVADIEGNILGPITHSLSDGLTPEEYYEAAAEGRRGFYYKAAMAAKPGYLARRVTTSCAPIVVNENIDDCGCTKYLKISVDKKLAKVIVGRYYYDEKKAKNILIETPDQVIGKTINLRSPLFCKSEGMTICPICAGNSHEKFKNKNIGVLVGGAVNDIVLNTYMKMRHKSSITAPIMVNFIKELDKYNMLTNEFKECFEVTENKVIAKKEVYTVINTDDYSPDFFIESKDYYLLPGVITFSYADGDESVKSFTFPFSYKVKLMKTANIEVVSRDITITYDPGDLIMTQDFYYKNGDASIIESMLEGQAKYITDPELLTMALNEQIPNMDLVYIEIMVMNMFRDAADLSKQARHTNYSNYEICGQKKLPFVTSWESAISFENPKKAIRTGLVTGQNSVEDPITRIVNEKYS